MLSAPIRYSMGTDGIAGSNERTPRSEMTTKRPSVSHTGSAAHAAAANIAPAGDCALVVRLGDAMDRAVSRRVLALGERIAAERVAGLIEVVPGIAALTVHFDPDVLDLDVLSARLAALAGGVSEAASPAPARSWTIPTCYDPALGLDLGEVAARTGLGVDEVVARHAGRDFHVYMLGFLPGFPYMGDLDAALWLPRRDSPRVAVPAGAVAIAGAMTAIYPSASPGGWHIIGRTPAALFDVADTPPSVLAPGDAVRFEAVSRDDYERIADGVRAGTWRLVRDGEAG